MKGKGSRPKQYSSEAEVETAEVRPLSPALAENHGSKQRARTDTRHYQNITTVEVLQLQAACLCQQTGTTLRKGRESTNTKLSEKILNAQSRAAVIYFASRQTRNPRYCGHKAEQPKKYCCPVLTVPVIIACF